MLQPIPLAVASDAAASPAFSSQRLRNWYVETTPTRAKGPLALYCTPGAKPWATVGTGPIRGGRKIKGTLYVVSGSNFYKVTRAGVATLIGAVAGSGPVVMSVNDAAQLAIALSDGTGYIYDSTAGTLNKITDEDFFGGPTVGYLNGYIIWGTADERFQISAVDAGADYDALDFASAESSPDNLKRIYVDHGEVWLMGEETIEIWYNSGAADFPFAPVNQTVIPKGIVGRYCVGSLDSTVFWVGIDPEAGGGPVVYRANGYVPERISTHAIERILATVTDFDQVVAVTYVQDGHSFFGLILPSAPAVFYDVATGLWHERESYGLGRWIGACHFYAYEKQLIGSYRDGKIFELDQSTFTDDTDLPVISELVSIPLGDDGSYHVMSAFQIDIEGGAGLNTGQGSDPQMMLSYSDDRGFTWSNELWRSMGAIGNYGLRVVWRRLGQFRSRVFKIRISDPVKRVVIQAFADF
jgi:hypothetical protein